MVPCGSPGVLFCFPDKTTITGLGSAGSLGNYYFTNTLQPSLRKGDSAYYIIPSNQFDYKALDRMTGCFTSYDLPLAIVQYWSGIVCKHYFVFRLNGYKGVDMPAVR